MNTLLHSMSHLDMDFEDYVQTKIALTRDPTCSNLYQPSGIGKVNAAVINKTIVCFLDDFSLFQRGTHVVVCHFAGMCVLSYIRHALLKDASIVTRGARAAIEIVRGEVGRAKRFVDHVPVSRQFVKCYEELTNTLFLLESVQQEETKKFLYAIERDLMAAACHPRRYIQCLDTEDAAAFTGVSC